ncbi:DUF7666 domain-containing protein [Enterocloster bolteae]|uniref:DUF7666 domain-containing protein n=1 Tax=Enterocloster bolteae TaxID=208479 RepID=UPI00210D3846|nr:hypothetical protein [Enterocloster bolteae]MCQ5141348.1 hypothetical protein [Enterocloster bolteae]
MKAFKGFNKDLTCRGYQYEEGKEFHTERAECCDTGFHACEYPLDCFGYYDPAHSVFHEVELSGEMDKSGDNTKVCATDIKIGARLSIAGLVKMAIDFTMSKVNKEAGSDERHGFASATGYKGASSATGDYGASSATGDYGASSATGDYGASSATGYKGASSATGYCGASSATGDYGASSATGYKGASSATGDYGASSATGDYGASSATGDYGASSATGDYGASSATGYCGASSATGYKGASSVSDPTGVAVAWGHEARAKGCKGAHLILSDWKYVGVRYSDGDYMDLYDKESWELTGAKMVVVDGEKIKEDTYYRCIEGEIVEVTEDGEIVEE